MTEQTAAPATSSPKVMNRNLVIVGAILIQLCLGAIYAWSVFTPFLVIDVPAKDKETEQYKDQVVYMKAGDAYIPMVTAIVTDAAKAKLDESQEVRTYKAMVLTDAEGKTIGVPDKYPDNKVDPAKLKEVDVDVVVSKKLDTTANPLAPKASHIAAATAKWSKTQSQIVFAAGLATFAVVMVLAGRMMPKVGPRKLAMAGGLVLGLGYVLAGVLGSADWMTTFICVGLVGGAGIGLGYVVPIAVGMKWFPDKKGMITGLAVAGFGFGALLWVKLGGAWGTLLATQGLDTTFIIYGIAFFLSVFIGGLWMVNPPADWKPAGWTPPVASTSGKPVAGTVDFRTGEMLAKPQFYMILLTFAFGASAGLMTIGLMKLFPKQALGAAGFTSTEASAIAGTAMGVFFALANGIGRIVWGTVSDKLGPKKSIIFMTLTQGVIVICFQWMAGTPALLYLGAALIGFNFGGNFALFPMITADTFGTKYIGQNYGWVFLAYGIGGIFGPILGGKLGDMGDFAMAFTICGGLCLVAGAVIAGVSHPKKAVANAA